ncbi:MAG TPA: hypothetical protein VLB09_08730 [Nitrospiria bacterium]|nr:hypothetical protein [Nitrospiria bacterium]
MKRIGEIQKTPRIIPSAIFLILTVCFFAQPPESFPQQTDYQSLIAEGDLHWLNRAAGSDGPSADPMEIDRAIASYRKALAEVPGAIPARWKLMRALYFKGEFTTQDKEERQAIYKEGIRLGEEALEILRGEAAERSGKKMKNAGPEELAVFKGQEDVTATLFWYSVQWGNWALAYGKFNAARKGAAGKIRDLAEAVILVDPGYEEGGGHRVLGRLHDETPDIPLITGWVSKRKAVESLRKAQELGPNYFLNVLYLSEAIGKQGADGRAEAVGLLEELLRRSPRHERRVEDRKALEDARVLLEKLEK